MKAHENPFASHIISSIEFQFTTNTQDLNTILQRFEQNNRRGAVVGRHGSGKTTLLRSIRDELEHRGFATHSVELRTNEQHNKIELPSNSILLLDGAEQINPAQWWLLMRRSQRAKTRGIIITTHTPQKLATIFETHPTPKLFAQLVQQLADSKVCTAELDTVYTKHSGNIREALREMYDRFSRVSTGCRNMTE